MLSSQSNIIATMTPKRKFLLLIIHILLTILPVFASDCILTFGKTKPINVCKNVTNNFSKLNALYSLSCVDCNLNRITEDTLAFFQGELLNLTNNKIEEISPYAFEKFQANTRTIILDKNHIKSFKGSWIKHLRNLTLVSLRNNEIQGEINGDFDDLSTEKLDLSHNHFTKIKKINNLSVQVLKFSFNKLTEIHEGLFDNVHFKTFTYNSSMELYLDNNNISVLHTNSFRGLTWLNHLDLSFNHIEAIPRCVFAFTKNLRVLKLNNNKIKHISAAEFANIHELTELDLSNNRIVNIEMIDIFKIGTVQTLDISSNHFTELNAEILFEVNSKLKNVILNDNFWLCKNLDETYRVLIGKTGSGFVNATNRYNVPNYHGIACTKNKEVKLQPETFNDFLDEIRMDLQENFGFGEHREDMDDMPTRANDNFFLAGIFYQLLIITIIVFLLFAHFMYKQTCEVYLKKKGYRTRRFRRNSRTNATIMLL